MPIEIASKPGDLQPAWPLSSDLAKTADDHLRLLKTMMQTGYLGEYFTISEVRALPFDRGAFFTYSNALWQIRQSSLALMPERLDKFIILTSGKIALKITNLSNAGTDLYQASVLPTAGGRFPKLFVISGSEAAFSSGLATASAPGALPVGGDVCVQLFTNWWEARIYSNSAWVPLTEQYAGHKLTSGNQYASTFVGFKLLGDLVQTDRQVLFGSTHMEVSSANVFGPDDLRYWFGAKAGLVTAQGEVHMALLSKANAIEWKSYTAQAFNGSGTPTDGGDVVDNLGLGAAYTAEGASYAAISLTFGVAGTFSVGAVDYLSSGSPESGNYVTTPSPATGSLYEIRFEYVSGTSVSGTLNTWLSLTESRSVDLTATATSYLVTRTGVVKVRIRKVGTPASEKTRDITLSAVAEPLGPMP